MVQKGSALNVTLGNEALLKLVSKSVAASLDPFQGGFHMASGRDCIEDRLGLMLRRLGGGKSGQIGGEEAR